ncbi:MAG: competence/damage-inducible protein A [Alphaproteobacteria bacterium]|nr:competence/damage-inducible protein A [Alphaproteobacteria bacterium]
MSNQGNSTLQPTAALIVIGNEILSGRTQDQNVAFIAQKLNNLGIILTEVSIIPDIEEIIIQKIQILSKSYSYVFTTGGIGPTHDDITIQSVAKAFHVPLELNQSIAKVLEDECHSRGIPLNEARLKMALVPKGAKLIPNSVTHIPGVSLENVYVFAGIPIIMRAMFEEIIPLLNHGSPIKSQTIQGYAREGDLAAGLTQIQQTYPQVDIGSYPVSSDDVHSVSIVVRGTDEKIIASATKEVIDLMRQYGGEPLLGSVNKNLLQPNKS